MELADASRSVAQWLGVMVPADSFTRRLSSKLVCYVVNTPGSVVLITSRDQGNEHARLSLENILPMALLLDCVKTKLLDRSPLMNDGRKTAFLIRQPGRKEQRRPLTCTAG